MNGVKQYDLVPFVVPFVVKVDVPAQHLVANQMIKRAKVGFQIFGQKKHRSIRNHKIDDLVETPPVMGNVCVFFFLFCEGKGKLTKSVVLYPFSVKGGSSRRDFCIFDGAL